MLGIEKKMEKLDGEMRGELPFLIYSLNRIITQDVKSRFIEKEINFIDLMFLIKIENSPGVTLYKMSKELTYDNSFLYKKITSLKKRGYVESCKKEKVSCLYLTEKAIQIVNEYQDSIAMFSARIKMEGLLCSLELKKNLKKLKKSLEVYIG